MSPTDKPYRCPKCREPLEDSEASICSRCGFEFSAYTPPSARPASTTIASVAEPPLLQERARDAGRLILRAREIPPVYFAIALMVLIAASVFWFTRGAGGDSGVAGPNLGAWQIVERADPLYDTQAVVAELPSYNERGKIQARLAVACIHGRQTEVTLQAVGFLFGRSPSVTLRFDDESAVNEVGRWMAVRDDTLRRERRTERDFARNLRDHDLLIARVFMDLRRTPEGRTVTFDLAGAHDAIEPVAEACGWWW